MKGKWKAVFASLVICVGAVLFFQWVNRTSGVPDVSLKFRRYSTDMDPYVQDVAFLWLTNASDQPYVAAMTGGTNTLVANYAFGHHDQHWMLCCAFEDETPDGTTNWNQPLLSPDGHELFLRLDAHSGFMVRVPLPPVGQKRKVAVLCRMPTTRSSFWSGRVGRWLFLRLPRSVQQWVIHSEEVWIKVWCDRELTRAGP